MLQEISLIDYVFKLIDKLPILYINWLAMESRESVDLDLQKFWYIIKRRWLPATCILTISVGAAALLGSFKKPVFEAQGKLLIKKVNQTSALTGLGQGIGQLEGLGTSRK